VIQSLLDGDTLPENDLRAMVNLIDKDKANQGYSSIYFEVKMMIASRNLEMSVRCSFF